MPDKKQKEDDIDKKNTKITWIDVGAGSATHFALEGAPSTKELAAEIPPEKNGGVKNKEHLESNQSSI